MPARVALMSIGMYGHLAPTLRVGSVLTRAGHTVIAWAPEKYRREVEAIGAQLRAHEPLPLRMATFTFPEFVAGLAEATERCTAELADQLLDERIDLVAHDVHVPWGRVAADFLGLPRIASTAIYPTPASGERGPWGTAPRLGADAAAAIAQVDKSRLAVQRGWDVDIGDWGDLVYNSGPATICLTTAELAGHDDLPPGWQYVGPLLDPQPPRKRAAGTRPLVYASFGTFFDSRPMAPRATIAALATEPIDVLLSTGRTNVSREALGPLPDNVTVRDFVDAREVLARTDVFVTHAGTSSVHEALLAGVPMLCVPQFADHFAWSRRVEALGVGQMVDPRPEAIREAVRRLLADEQTRVRARELGEHLAASDGARRVLELVEHLTSTQVPT